jgi:hypothetical protein
MAVLTQTDLDELTRSEPREHSWNEPLSARWRYDRHVCCNEMSGDCDASLQFNPGRSTPSTVWTFER